MRLEVIKELDSADPFAEVRKAFSIPVNKIYLDGNSLGPLTLVAKKRALEVIEQQWGNDLISSWNLHDWINLPIKVGEKIGPLLGASSNQTICCDSVSINLFKLITCALAGNPERTTILSTTNNFPTDLYVAEGIQRLLGENRCRLQLVENHELNSALKQKPGVLLLTQTDYRTGEIFDIEELTSQAHANGTPVIWDLSHSVGVLPLEMDKWNVDFAVGCTYKYLNGGPGAPAFLYVAHNQQENCVQPLSGWMGHKAPFEFISNYTIPKEADWSDESGWDEFQRSHEFLYMVWFFHWNCRCCRRNNCRIRNICIHHISILNCYRASWYHLWIIIEISTIWNTA